MMAYLLVILVSLFTCAGQLCQKQAALTWQQVSDSAADFNAALVGAGGAAIGAGHAGVAKCVAALAAQPGLSDAEPQFCPGDVGGALVV